MSIETNNVDAIDGENGSFFLNALKEAEKRLTKVLNGKCKINVYNKLNEELIKIIQEIEEKFIENLRYSRDELILRGEKKDFICLTLEFEGKVVAFDMGYEDDDEEGVFFSDDTATLIEGKGIGRTLFALEIIYSYERGYGITKLFTEEVDSNGKPLKDIWGKMGFEVVSKTNENLEMKLNHTPKNIESIYFKHIR